VNVWILAERDGWTVIDTGCATPETIETWETLLAGPMKARGVQRLIMTHGHVDHIGLAGWMMDRFSAEFLGTFPEWIWARLSHTRDVPGSRSAHYSYLVKHGIHAGAANTMVESRHGFMDLSTSVPGRIDEIRDGDSVTFGGRQWRVIVTGGHAYAHASFYDAAANILIAGDHLLPTITPVIAVYEMLPNGDPLGDYLSSFPQFDSLPDDVLVLPSHGMPYRGIRGRIRQLIDHHERRLAHTLDFLREPRTALDLSRNLFPRVEGPDNIGFALGETLAHVNHLLSRGQLVETIEDDGRAHFRAKPDSRLAER
jgi:glyoxylase-like metal-dependent hydrolase (beta-lactamase superfamily II)